MNKRVDAIQQMLLKEPDDSFLNYALALELASSNQHEKATAILQQVLSSDKQYLPAYYQLGKCYEQTHQKEKAILIYKNGIEIAKQQKAFKALAELTEAIKRLEEEG